MVVTLVLSHGPGRLTAVALLGTTLALFAAVVLSTVAIEAASLTGFADEDASLLEALLPGIDVRGLMLAAIIIGTLGVLDDVTITQAAIVFELNDADRRATRMLLFQRAMRVGREHIASVVNTLALAYTGAALPLILLLATRDESLRTLISFELLTTEFVRALVGSIGLVLAVPFTTGAAVLVATSQRFGASDAPRRPPT